MFKGHVLKWLGSSLYMRNTRKKKKQPLLLFKQPPLSDSLWLNHSGWRVIWKENSYLGSTDSENAFCFWCNGANRRWFLSWRGMQNPHAGIFGIKSGTFQGFSIFKGSSKPNPIQTICQSLFSIWDYTFSRVKVMKVTEHAVCKIWFQLRRFWLRQKRFKKPESIRPKLIQINRKILK